MTPLTVLALVSLALSGQVGAVADVRAVTVVATPATVSLCRSALSGHKLLALDCEGVNLGRRGEISLIQLATPEECFLLDVQDAPRTADVVALAKEILEDESVCKIIHDCKADSDALSHLLGIELKNVHDTQAWHVASVDPQTRRPSLNGLLELHSIPTNVVRDSGVYKTNERFWATRPLTQGMIEWASGDVTSLFLLREGQTTAAPDASALQAAEASEANLGKMREGITAEFAVEKDQMGRFIGRGGCNIRAVEERFQVVVHQYGDKSLQVFLLYAKDAEALRSAVTHLRGMGFNLKEEAQ